MSEPTVISTKDDLAALWLHMLDDHGLSPHATHGDPVMMHGAAHAFGLCERQYAYAPDAPDFRAEQGSNTDPRRDEK